jgi:hypothetical protein
VEAIRWLSLDEVASADVRPAAIKSIFAARRADQKAVWLVSGS